MSEIRKGSRVKAQYFRAEPLGSYSLAGLQMKFVGHFVEVTGTVRHIRGDHPTTPKAVQVYIEPDEEGQGKLCEKCGVPEVVVNLVAITEML